MLRSPEKCSFRNVYISMLVGTKQLYTQEWLKKYRYKYRFKTITYKLWENVKMSNFVSLILVVYSKVFNYFAFALFWWLNKCFIMDLASAYDKKWPLFTLYLKTDVTLVQKLRFIVLDFLTWNFFPDEWSLNLDAVKWQWKPDTVYLTHKKNIAKFSLHSIYTAQTTVCITVAKEGLLQTGNLLSCHRIHINVW